MAGFLFIFICLLVNSVEQTYSKEEIIMTGNLSDWWNRGVDTSEIKAQGWETGQITFESNDPTNGAWAITDSVKLHALCNYHLNIEAKRTECLNQTTCSLQIFIHNGSKELDLPNQHNDNNWKQNSKIYLLSNFKKLHDVTLTEYNKIETQSFSFSYNGSAARFAIRARAIAGELHNMKLYYYYCEDTLVNGVKLARINAPSSGWERVVVNCRNNAVSKNNETSFEGLCWYNGTWSIGNDTECLCRPGYYEMPDKNPRCERCPKGYYKSNTSNEKCTSCPERSTSDNKNIVCNCLGENFRLPNQLGVNTAPCYGFPSKVDNIKIKIGESRGTITLSWDPPSDPLSLRYDVSCGNLCKLTFQPSKKNLRKTTVKIFGLITGRHYNFKVFSKNEISKTFGNGTFPFANKTYKYPRDERFNPTNEFMIKIEYKIVAAIGALLILILIIVLICILRRKRQKHSKCALQDIGIELPDIGQKMYIDPLNYVDAETALKDFAHEIDPASLSLERLIGGGEFGDVYKGTLTLQDGNVLSVAAKTLKPNAGEKSCRDFFLEASAMGQFYDPNVIHLEGVVTKVLPKMILTEFMLNGSLDHFLKKNDGGFTAIQLFSIALDVASGMKYLAGMNFVHRDLAARNILVDENMVCKVADFGLSRELETADSSRGEYFTQGGKIPVRWTAPEAIKYRIFSTASDVWSFGILLWEIMSAAQRPYWDWDNFKVMERVDEGFRLPSPVNCPQAVHELMLKCWDKERSLRPRFEDILVTIDEWIESPEILHQPIFRDRTNQVPYKESTTSVKEWLDEIKMSSYMPHFAVAGYERVADLAGLLDNDLKDLGIGLVGHRNKMLRTIRSLPITQEKNI